MKISLIGFMGTGKSTIAEMLSQRLALTFIETDNKIKAKEDKSINKIFAEKGEKYFRKLEHEVLKEVIFKKEEFVLSTGGGIILSRDNRDLLKKETFPILLEASPEEILQRTKNEGKRPLLNTENPLQSIKKLKEKRAVFYNQFSPKIYTDKKTPTQVLKEILKILEVDED